ncbi:hypothetical protein [Streptomyces sp. 2131.1]|uniref:hypothetical protein n=1 Tax=Streptomyces sp. 2131.1 TaxID=1855346 RepID=UPI002109D43D|nr:hypothetical protein [Streptomyces sp. 2131.1]
MVVAAVYFVTAAAAAVILARSLDRQTEGPRLRVAWAGRTAEARCTGVRAEEAQDAEGVLIAVSHATLEFRTGAGRTVAFQERQRRLDVTEGDFTVYYAQDAPEAATAREPSFGLRCAPAAGGRGGLRPCSGDGGRPCRSALTRPRASVDEVPIQPAVRPGGGLAVVTTRLRRERHKFVVPKSRKRRLSLFTSLYCKLCHLYRHHPESAFHLFDEWERT